MSNYLCLNAAKLQAFQPAECSAATNGEPSMAETSNTQTICCKDSKNFENSQIIRRESFVFYRGFFEAIKEMPEGEIAGAFLALCEYALNGEITREMTQFQNCMFICMKPQIDANNKKYENGKKGGRPKGGKVTNNQTETETKPNNNQTETNRKPNVNDNVNVNVNDNVNANDLSIKEKVREKSADFAAANAATLSQSIEVVEPEIVKPVVVADGKEKRKQKFYNKLSNYIQEYGLQMVTEFFDYWTESNENGKKMRFEMEKVFDINKRLKTWANRQKQFNTQSNGQRIYKTATERTRDEYLKTIEGVYADIAGK